MGITLAGVTTVPFSVQNIFRSKWMPATEEIFASLFIGNNFSRIDVYNKENLVMTRGIKTFSGNSMIEAIVASVFEKTGNIRLKYDEAKMQQAFIKVLENAAQSIAGSNGRIEEAHWGIRHDATSIPGEA